MDKWIDNRTSEPTTDGVYLVQMVANYITGMSYTREGGWNTRYNRDGELQNDSHIDSNNVARWLDAPTPPEVSDEWFLEAMRRTR